MRFPHLSTIGSLTKLLQDLVPTLAFIAALVGWLNRSKLSGTPWRTFPLYLLVISSLDFIGGRIPTAMNVAYYTYFVNVIEGLYFPVLFYQLARLTQHKTLLKVLITAQVVSFLVFGLWFYEDSGLTGIIYSNNNLILIFAVVILYYIELFQSEDLLKFTEDLRFWVSSGLIIYYLFTFPYWSFRFLMLDPQFRFGNLFFYAFLGLDYLMYLLFSIGFLCMKRPS